MTTAIVYDTVLTLGLNLTLAGIGGGVSLAACLVLALMGRAGASVRPRRHGGPQQIHDRDVFRIGGAAILLGLFAQFVLVFPRSHELVAVTFYALPVAMAGMAEDVWNCVSAGLRLLISAVSAMLLVTIGGYVISEVGFLPVDLVLGVPFVAVFLSVLAIVTCCHAINIIDGLNGLAGGTCVLGIGAVTLMAHGQGDSLLAFMGLSVLLPLAGFLLLNFPRGLVFLGDGGAYFLGCVLAALVITLPTRNFDVSSFASLLVVAYPVYETIRSFARRSLGAGALRMVPDGRHLHSLVFALFRRRLSWPGYAVNASAALVVLVLPGFCCVVAVAFHNRVEILMVALVAMIACYELLMRAVQNRL